MIDVQQLRRGGGALDVTADLDELPALAVAHGGIGDALKQMHAFVDEREEIRRAACRQVDGGRSR